LVLIGGFLQHRRRRDDSVIGSIHKLKGVASTCDGKKESGTDFQKEKRQL
jgi:hypothetical protein